MTVLNAQTQLWKHQQQGVMRLLNEPRMYLAWEMGTGKSLAVVTAIAAGKWKNTMIVCPKSVVPVWPEQFKRHLKSDVCDDLIICSPTKGTVKKKTEQMRGDFVQAAEADKQFVMVLNTESAWRDPMGSALARIHWDAIVIDEAHRGSSSPRGKFYRWVQRLKANHRVALSGTPLSHSPLNAYPQFKFLAPATMTRTFTQFKSRYAVMGGFHANGRPVQIVGYQNLDDLERRIAPHVDRVKKSDVLDLPGVVHETHHVELPASAMRVYKDMEDDLIAGDGDQVITAANVLSKTMKLRQIVQGSVVSESGGMVHVHDSKSAMLTELIGDMNPANHVVVFCTFHTDLDQVISVADKLGRKCYELSGRRSEIAGQWQPDEPGCIAAVQIQSGGVGIDLTASSDIVFFSLDWSLSNYDQAIARCDRPGQTSKVTVHHLMATGTVDETIRKAVDQRRSIVDAVMERIGKLAKGN